MNQNENESPGTPPPLDNATGSEPPQPPPRGPQSSFSESFNQPPPASEPPPDGHSEQARQWAMFAHFSALTGLFSGGLGCILGPLIIWLVKKDTMPFVEDQAKEALNFNITMGITAVILMVVGTILMVILVGFLFYLAAFFLGIFWLVVTIVAAIKANEGVAYRYPLTLRLIK